MLSRLRTLALAISALIAAPAAAQEAAPLRPALWQVSDGDTTIYLFGTIHALPQGTSWLDGAVAEAIDSSAELVTELPDVDPTTVQSFVSANALLPKGKTLRSVLTPEQRGRLEARLNALGVPVAALDQYEPWFAYVALLQVELTRLGITGADGVERALEERMVKRAGRPHIGLETLQYQLGIFDALPLATQGELLAAMADAGPTLREDFAQMVDDWGNGRDEALASLMNKDEYGAGLLDVLLTRRNRNWAQWVKGRLDKPGTVFLAVGAGHLAGPGSLQEQLKVLGIKSERLQ